ncbi:MAG: TIGR03905 family TSCPD domain-containing protein [Eubacterium sp.]|nr:TIGR03905 family TSCPD domain-containing protein [Eubacterium sp.]
MHYEYKTENTCSTLIEMDINDGIVTNLHFEGGCNGNLKAIPILVEGMTADEIAAKLTGLTCGRRPTSCGDQLSKAVLAAKEAEKAGAI